MDLKRIKLTNQSLEFFNNSNIYFWNPHAGLEVEYLEGTTIEPYTRFASGGNDRKFLYQSGAFSYTSSNSISLGLQVGRYCSISWGLKFTGGRHTVESISTHPFVNLDTQNHPPIKDFISTYAPEYSQRFIAKDKESPIIGNDVWIGMDVTLNKGIIIGDGAVIAGSSVVTRNIPAYEIWGGNPARLIKKRFDDETIALIIETEWWKYKFTDLNGLPLDQPILFCEQFLLRKISLEEYAPQLINLENLPGEELF